MTTYAAMKHPPQVAEDKQTESEPEPPAPVFKVAFVNPSSKGNAYWDRYVDYMRVAAKCLNIDLHVEYAEGNRLNTPELAQKLVSQKNPPDYLVYIFQYGQSLKVLTLAEHMKVKSFIVNTNVTDAEKEIVGKPREKFKYWIGHLHATNEIAGEKLANHLVQLAEEKKLTDENGNVHLLAISGSRDSTAAIDFNKGLSNALNKNKSIMLEQLVFSNWFYNTALRQAEGLLLRYPKTSVMWSIGEDVALGMLDGAKLVGRQPGIDILIGGTVSTSRGVEAIKKGMLTANMGGDSWEGARALVMLFDYHHGIDFASNNFSLLYTTRYVSQKNVEPYEKLITEQKWKDVDYRKMSRFLNPNKKDIKFDVETLLEAADSRPEN